MKSSIKNNIEGKMHRVKGRIKETIGRVLNNRGMEAEGQLENIKGKDKEKIGKLKKIIKK